MICKYMKPLQGHKSAMAGVNIHRDSNDVITSIDLYSYDTRVITVDLTGARRIECTGTYSATTRKHIGWFCREYLQGLCYHDMKRIIGDGYVAM